MENENNNKMILQSYKLTEIRNDFGIYAQRLIVRIAEKMQYRFEEANFLTKEIRPGDERLIWYFKLSDLQQEGEKNHTHVKEELRKVIKASVYAETEMGWSESIIFTDITFTNADQSIKVKINDSLWYLFVEISKGFKKYQLDTALKLKTTYALRLYQLLNGNTTPITYTIDWLKEMFKLQDKYKNNNDFIRRVIEPARKELDEKAETSFNYVVNTKAGRGRPTIESLTFYTFKTYNKANAEIQRKEANRKYGLAQVPMHIEIKLMQNYGFTEQGIKANADTFALAYDKMKKPTLEEFLDKKRASAMKADNPQGYIIGAIQKELYK